MEVRNDTKGVMNVGGKVIAPGKTADVDGKSPGLQGALKRKSLSKVSAKSASSQGSETSQQPSKANKSESTASQQQGDDKGDSSSAQGAKTETKE